MPEIQTDMVAELRAEVARLKAALDVCAHTLHRRDPSPAEEHAAQQASGAGVTDWVPEYVEDDLPDFKFGGVYNQPYLGD